MKSPLAPASWPEQQDWYAGLARRILSKMAEQHLTIHKLSYLSGIQFTLTSGYIREGRKMPVFALMRYAHVLDVTASDLIGDLRRPVQESLFSAESLS